MNKQHKPKTPKTAKKNKRRKETAKQFLLSSLLGTQLTVSLVNSTKEQPVPPEDKPSVNAIKDSAWRTIMEVKQNTQDPYTWIAACILAAYQLGKHGLPTNAQIDGKSKSK